MAAGETTFLCLRQRVAERLCFRPRVTAGRLPCRLVRRRSKMSFMIMSRSLESTSRTVVCALHLSDDFARGFRFASEPAYEFASCSGEILEMSPSRQIPGVFESFRHPHEENADDTRFFGAALFTEASASTETGASTLGRDSTADPGSPLEVEVPRRRFKLRHKAPLLKS